MSRKQPIGNFFDPAKYVPLSCKPGYAPELETLYSDRLRSRLREMCIVLSFPATAPDRRR